MSICAEASDADQWIKTVYNETNGLDTGEANAVLQTSDGYIWIGSYGGLLRYDGVDFENFSIGENSVGSSSIRALYEDESGRLFIGTNDVGVYVYEDGCFQSVPLEDGGTDYYSVRSFTEDAEGNVYVGTTSGLARIAVRTEDADPDSTNSDSPDDAGVDNDSSVNNSADNDSTDIDSADDGSGQESTKDSSGFYMVPVDGAEGRVVYDLTCDSDGMIWGCAEDSVLLLVMDGELSGTLDADGWFQNDCYSVFAASDGSIYLGSGGSEAIRLEKTGSGYNANDFEADILDMGDLYAANRFYETSDGTVWVLCDDGIACLDAENVFETPEGMAGMISCCGMIEDYEGNFWVVSSRTGMTYFSKGKFYNYNDRAGLEGQAVNAILRQGEFTYLGTDSGLIILDENFERVENELTEMMESRRVRHITCDSSGVFWFCVYGTGLVRYDPEEDGILLLTEEDGLLGNQVRMTLELRDGSLAVAGSSGIDIIKDGEISRSYGSDVLPYSFVLCMYETDDGTLVAGSDGQGIYTITPDGEITQYYSDDGLKAGSVMRMKADEDGVWISAGSSFYYQDQDGIREITLPESAGSILDIQLTGDEIWLMKSSGILIFDKEELLSGTAAPRELNTEYGLTGTLVANSWNWLDEDGTLWLCTNNGISAIDTENIPTNENEPRGAVSAVMIDNEEFAVSDEITIPASAKRVTFELSVLSFTPGSKTVEYTLEGFDEDSSMVSSSVPRSASYTNLNGGDYVFRMIVYNEDSVEGEEIRIAVHKEYHFWETRWFYALTILLVVLVVFIVFQIFYQYRVRSLKKRQEELKLIIEQSLHTFANAIDAKDEDTNGHSVRVAAYSREIARRMNFSEEDQEWISYMALLHDIGKIGIPDEILKKTGKLSPEEWEIVKSHPRIGGEILSEFTVIPDIADGAKYHHEHFDGNGYCEGLKGEEIPLKARIIAIADSFDAMCSARHYQTGRPLEYARAELLRCSGTQFDPDIVGYMIDMIDDGFVDQVKVD